MDINQQQTGVFQFCSRLPYIILLSFLYTPGNEVLILIEKNWNKISERLGTVCPRNGENGPALDDRVTLALQGLTENHAQDARQRLATTITGVIGERWRKDVADYITKIKVCHK